MKKLALLLLAAVALAGGAGVGAIPMSGGAHGQAGSHHGFVDHRGFVHHGFDHRFDGHHRHFHGHGSVFIAVPFWGPPIYYAQPVYVVPNPPAYIEQGSNYWYYCNDPAGYYPSVQNCPQGWQRVIPAARRSAVVENEFASRANHLIFPHLAALLGKAAAVVPPATSPFNPPSGP